MQLVELLQMILRDGILGFLVGILIGLTGIGGGAVIQPILIIGLGLSPVASVGTGLLFAMVTKIGGAVTHIRMRNIRPRRTLFFLCGSVPSVLIAPYAVNRLISQYGATIVNHYLQCGMALVMLATAVFMLLQHLFLKETLETEAQVYCRSGPFPLRQKLATIASGGVIGALIGATSIGGGVLIIPVMLWLNAGIAEAVGSSLVISLLLSGLGSLVYLIEGHIQLQTVATLSLGSIPGVILGSRLTRRIPERILLVIVMILVAASGICLLMHSLFFART